MLINLNWENSLRTKQLEYNLKFDLPSITFKNNTTVHVNEIGITSKEALSSGVLITSLIDKSPENPRQLLRFHQPKKSMSLFYTPTSVQKYKIQCFHFENAEFILKLKENIIIEEVYVQLEVTNAGIQ